MNFSESQLSTELRGLAQNSAPSTALGASLVLRFVGVFLFLSLPLNVYFFGMGVSIRVIVCRTLNLRSVLFVFRMLCFRFHKTQFEFYLTTGFLPRRTAIRCCQRVRQSCLSSRPTVALPHRWSTVSRPAELLRVELPEVPAPLRS